MGESEKQRASAIDPIGEHLFQLGREYARPGEKRNARDEWILYMHPYYMRRILKEMTSSQIHNLDFYNQRRTIMGFDYIESDEVPEFPGWLVLPKFIEPKESPDGR